MKPVIKHVLATTIVLFAGGVIVAALVVFSGVYNFAADVPHTAPVYALLETMRERSIQARSIKIQNPDLTDHTRMLRGAGNSEDMCVQCHRDEQRSLSCPAESLATEIRAGSGLLGD